MIVGHSSVGWGCAGDHPLIERECGSHAFSHTKSGMVDLGTLGKKTHTTRSMALAVNNNGMIVGQSTTADSNDRRAFSYTEGGPMIDIGTLGGDDSIAYGVNNNGMIVGQSQTADGNIRAFSYTDDGSMTDIGTLGGDYSIAYAVNADGMIVGESETADGKVHAFAYMAGADMLDLGTSPLVDGTSSMAYGVNDAGLIVGQSIDRDPEGGGTRYFYQGQAFWAGVYVNEVPEPSTATLLFGALTGLLWNHRRVRHG